jgi:uncharacterized LabA/DUF88 family protein
MASSDNISMAVFCDFENVALGVRDANYEKFDIKPVLERLLLKGSIVVKKSYCDWDRYKGFKSTMHEANFELIEIPHVRQSGKNSADIRLVVDALDLCYTKSHVNTFVIISGDSDFSPLVSKLRENNKQVIGVGVKQSTSDLLVANCDEFIFYDDLVREVRRAAAKRDERKAAPQNNKRPSDDRRKEELEARKSQALDMVAETFDALVSERGDTGKIWASLLKDTLKRRRPEFSEVYYGFRTFGNLLEEAQVRGLFEFGRDEKSGTYVYRTSGANAAQPAEGLSMAETVMAGTDALAEGDEAAAPSEAKEEGKAKRSRGGRGRKNARGEAPFVAVTPDEAAEAMQADEAASEVATEAASEAATEAASEAATEAAIEAAREPAVDDGAEAWPAPAALEEVIAAVEPAVLEEAAPPAKKERRRTPRKPAARKGTAPAVEAAADAGQADASAAQVPVAEITAPVARIDASDVGNVADSDLEEDDVREDDVNGNVAEGAKPVRGGAGRPARKPAARSRRPAKPKAA